MTALLAVAALGLGAVSWIGAHALTWSLFAHTHDGLTPEHLHTGGAPAMVAAITLGATSLLAVAVGALLGAPVTGLPVRASRRLTLLSPAMFVGAELIEHAARGGLTDLPLTLAVLMVVAQAVAGAATPTLCLLCVHAVARVAALLAAFVSVGPRTEARAADLTSARSGTARLTDLRTRGPPSPRHHRRFLPQPMF